MKFTSPFLLLVCRNFLMISCNCYGYFYIYFTHFTALFDATLKLWVHFHRKQVGEPKQQSKCILNIMIPPVALSASKYACNSILVFYTLSEKKKTNHAKRQYSPTRAERLG